MAARVAVVGSINVDHTLAVDRFPRPGETLLADSLTHSVGGKGANQAAAAAHAGADVVMVGVVGADAEGDTALQELDRAGVDCCTVARVTGAPTGSAWITVTSGDNTILVVPGANHRWSGNPLPVQRDDIVLCQLEIPLDVVRRAATQADTFVLNAAPAQRLPDDLLARCHTLLVNEHELAEVSGRSLDAADDAAVVGAAQTLLERGVRTVVTTLGRRGAVLCSPGRALRATAPVVDVVDTTGAGDAFGGVFAAGLAAGASLQDALRCAVAAGSLAVQGATARGHYERFADLAARADGLPELTVLSER